MRSALTRLAWVLAAPAALTTVSACGLVLGLEDGVYVDGGLDSRVDPPGDAAGDAIGDAAPPPKDVIDIETNFASCDGAPPIDPNAIYVAPTGVDTSNCGAKASPCLTIAAAMLRASNNGKTVYLAIGKYQEQVLFNTANKDGTVIQGGFDDDAGWVPTCNQQLTTIKSTDHNVSVIVDGYKGTLRLLRVESQDLATTPGGSVYAVLVNDGTLTLDNAVLIAHNAANGSDGVTGSAGLGCGFKGDGQPGAAGGPGVFNGLNFVPAQAPNGNIGVEGTTNFGGASSDCTSCGSCKFGMPEGGLSEGGSQCSFGGPITNRCGNDGNAGCGGSGGDPGTGGLGGGASVALFIAGTKSSVKLIAGVSFNTGYGGTGGNGGNGGPGAPGGIGAPASLVGCEIGCLNSFTCDVKMLQPGDAGVGTAGGKGGQGGGGAGGPSRRTRTSSTRRSLPIG